MKRFFPLFGLMAVLVAVFVPANAFADGAYITVTETTPTTITIDTNLTGTLSSQSIPLTLFPGYFNNRAPNLVFRGPSVETNDSGSIDQYPGTLEIGDSLVGTLNPGYAGSVDNAINWLDPGSTPGNPLYDTLVFDGPGPVPDTSFLFSSENEVPTVGLQGAAICYDDAGSPVGCPVVPYGTVVNASYYLGWGANQTYGPITITFVDDVVATPEPATGMMLLTMFTWIGAAAFLRRCLTR